MLFFILLGSSFFPVFPARAASSLEQLEKKLSQEQKKAADRKQSLKRLSEQERQLNADLSAAETRILELEKGLELQHAKLRDLALADDAVRVEYETLLGEQAKTEEAQTDALCLLWEISGKRIAVGNRDMADWAQTDREYAWSKELYAVLEGYRKKLDEQEAKLIKIIGKRDKISREMQNRLNAVNEEKRRLLHNRLSYDKRLAELRLQRVDAESELDAILALVESLNLEITQRTGKDIEKSKGRLPWPVIGKIIQGYAPQAVPASRGLGIATAEKETVRAVAGGKVVHNDVLRGFGTVLILQHGDDYYSLYAFLGNSPLQLGQDVASRQQLGTVGYYPAIKSSGLYFELRFKQKAINPEQWLAR
ncbi:MAG: peptidoglycan DD-metalloendopeptidase family protein [Desulfovibrio sp.]|jgi:septal ring factor EnvC (AmiA/AmiB activator)|nr:peptidoglycan DD-metalloendopeptidase family protein [Desulfovibrio sp.]